MATINTDTFLSSANLSLWYKLRGGDPLNLADIPEVIPLRWTYFRDNWARLKPVLEDLDAASDDADYYRDTLDDLDTFMRQQQFNGTDNNPFSGNQTYYRFYPIFNAILIDQISTTNEERELIAKKVREVSTFSKNDFLKIKKDVTAYRDYLADTVGLADSDYNRIYDRGDVVSQIEPTIADMNLMLVLQQQLASVNFILANLFAVDSALDPFALAKINANNPDVKIGRYSSGYLVRLNSGEDLQGLATRYLGDPDKWIDIALANGLREPYIDEVGEVLPLVANGSENQINVSELDSSGLANINKLHINQVVYIQSDTSPFPSQRLIAGIKEVPVSGEIVVALTGDELSSYTLADNASIRVFKPNTVNSSLFVLIPSPSPLSNPREDEIPWFQTSSPDDEKKTKIDIALGDEGELVFTSNGDIPLSYNLANAIQAVKLKLVTEQGTNRYHPQFGLINLVGTPNNSEEATRNLLIESINAQIQADARFDRVESLSVVRNTASTAVAFNINLVVRLAGSNTLIPISFTVAT